MMTKNSTLLNIRYVLFHSLCITIHSQTTRASQVSKSRLES